MIDCICEHCGKPYTVAPYRIGKTKYCSRKCLATAKLIRMTFKCEYCKKKFVTDALRAKPPKYCSKKCKYEGLKGRGHVTFRCRHCHKTFRDAPSRERKYCSTACNHKSSIAKWNPSDHTTVRDGLKRRGRIVRCERCGYDKVPSILGIHHIDRDRSNNTMPNLQILCPNCHSEEHGRHITHGLKYKQIPERSR